MSAVLCQPEVFLQPEDLCQVHQRLLVSLAVVRLLFEVSGESKLLCHLRAGVAQIPLLQVLYATPCQLCHHDVLFILGLGSTNSETVM